MKPLTHCISCKSVLVRKTIPEHLNNSKYENCSSRCLVDYFQYYENSYDQEIAYISFNTPKNKFYVYVYFDHWSYLNIAHIYSQLEMNLNGVASPILKLHKNLIDLNDLDKLEEKLSILANFV